MFVCWDFCRRDDGRQSRSSCTVIVEGTVSEEGGMWGVMESRLRVWGDRFFRFWEVRGGMFLLFVFLINNFVILKGYHIHVATFISHSDWHLSLGRLNLLLMYRFNTLVFRSCLASRTKGWKILYYYKKKKIVSS